MITFLIALGAVAFLAWVVWLLATSQRRAEERRKKAFEQLERNMNEMQDILGRVTASPGRPRHESFFQRPPERKPRKKSYRETVQKRDEVDDILSTHGFIIPQLTHQPDVFHGHGGDFGGGGASSSWSDSSSGGSSDCGGGSSDSGGGDCGGGSSD